MRKAASVLLVLFMLFVAACGGGGGSSLIETAAVDMNLGEGDLGSGYTLTEEEGRDAVVTDMDLDEADDIEDANLRMFSSADSLGMVMSVVVNFKTVAAAKANMRGVTEGFEEGFNEELPGTEFAELSAPNIADDSLLIKADISDYGFEIYMLSFRKENVMGLIAAFGMSGSVTEDSVVELGNKLAGKVK